MQCSFLKMKTYNAEVVLHWGLDANKSEPINYDISIVKTQFSATILLLASFMVTGTCCNTCYKGSQICARGSSCYLATWPK